MNSSQGVVNELSNAASSSAPDLNDSAWVDATSVFRAACRDLQQGEIFHGPNFSLFNTMSAIEIGEPRMDSGAIINDLSNDDDVLEGLSAEEIIGVMDELFCCEASWHEGAALTANVLRCTLIHRSDLLNITGAGTGSKGESLGSSVLIPFVIATCRSVFLAWQEMSQGNFYDGEDIILERFGVSLADDVSNDHVLQLLTSAQNITNRLPESAIKSAIHHRLQLRRGLFESFCQQGSQIDGFHLIATSAPEVYLSKDLGKPVPRCFDDQISAKVAGCLPPRPTTILSLEEALEMYGRLMQDVKIRNELDSKDEILGIEEALLRIANSDPPLPAHTRSSVQTLLCGASGKYIITGPAPTIAKIIGEYGFPRVADLLHQRYATTTGNGTSDFDALFIEAIERAYQVYIDYTSVLMHNLPRQRRNLGKLLEHAQALSCDLKSIAPQAPQDQASALAIMLFWLDHLVGTMMVKILRDGFHLDLYSSREYPMMLFCLATKLAEVRSRLETWQLAGSRLMDKSSRYLESVTSLTSLEYQIFDGLLRIAVAVKASKDGDSSYREDAQENAGFDRRMHVLTTHAAGSPFEYSSCMAHLETLRKLGITELIRTAKSSLSLAGTSSNRIFRSRIKERDVAPTIYSMIEAYQANLQNLIVTNLAFASAGADPARLARAQWSSNTRNGSLSLHIPIRVLVSNDDGPPSPTESPFIIDFVKSLRETLGWKVTVVIPSSQKSWISKAFHIKEHIQTSWLYIDSKGKVVEQTEQPKATHAQIHDEWILLDGTPSTCVNIGLDHFSGGTPFDLVIAGPNYGRNTSAAFALSSGTVGAAMEGAICGVPSIALSYGLVEKPVPEGVTEVAHGIACRVIDQLWQSWPGREGRSGEAVALYNINIPLVRSLTDSTEVRWTTIYRNSYERLFKVVDPRDSASGTNSSDSAKKKQIGSDPSLTQPPAPVADRVTTDSGPDVKSATATASERSSRLTFKFAPDLTSLIASSRDLPMDTDARALQTDSVVSVTALRTGFDEVPLHLAKQQADLNQSRRSSGPLRLRGGSVDVDNQASAVSSQDNHDPLSNTLMPLTDATITIRVVKNFEYRIQRSAVIHHLDLKSTTVSDLFERIKALILQDAKFKAFRPVLDSFDTFKIYTQAHKTKTSNLIINLEEGGILEDHQTTLAAYGIDHECEISLFNREAYEKFKRDPQIKWE